MRNTIYLLFYLTIFSLAFRGIEVFGVKIADIILSLTIFIFFLVRKKIYINIRIIILFFILYSFVLFSLFKVEDFYFSKLDIFRYPLVLGIFILTANLVNTTKEFNKTFKIVLFAGLLSSSMSLIIFILWVKGIDVSPFLHILASGEAEGRVQTFFYDPNHYASFLMIPGIFSVFYLLKSFKEKNHKTFLIFTLFFFIISGAIITTGSRGAVVSLVVGLLVIGLLIFKEISRKKMLITVIILLIILVGFGYISLDVLTSGVEKYKELIEFREFRHGSVEGGLFLREQLWRGSIYAFIENPLTGVGTSNYVNIYPELAEKYDLYSGARNFPHNSYLGLLAEIGLIGFLASMLILIYITKLSVKNIRYGYDSKISIILFSILVAELVNMFFLDMFNGRRLWFLFGLIVAYSRISYRELYLEERNG